LSSLAAFDEEETSAATEKLGKIGRPKFKIFLKKEHRNLVLLTTRRQ
jgi:hypothetical protein